MKARICKNFLELAYKHFRKEKITDSHQIQWYNVKSSEWGISKREIDGKTYLVVAIVGSNDIADWILNFFLASWKGFKFCGWMESKRVFKSIKKLKIFNIPIILCGHSKSGCTLPPLEMMLIKSGFEIDSIYSFDPARCLRKSYKIDKMTMFIDKNDPVPMAGAISFRHPYCEVIYHPEKDPKGIDFSDHRLEHWDGVV